MHPKLPIDLQLFLSEAVISMTRFVREVSPLREGAIMRRSSFQIVIGVAAVVLIVSGFGWKLGAAEKAEFGDDFHFYPASEEHQQKLDALVGKPMPPLSVSGWV